LSDHRFAMSLGVLEAPMNPTRSIIALSTALLLPLGTAAAEDHIPGPDESSSPSQMLATSGGGPLERTIKQRKSRTTYKAMRGASVEDPRYLGREIPLDLASVSRADRDGLSLYITLYEPPVELAPESMVVYFATPGAVAPQWAAYQPAPQDGEEDTAWGLYRYDPSSGLFDAHVAEVHFDQQGELIRFSAERDDAMPRSLVAFVETRSGDDEDWAWKDQAPTRRTGLRLR
jgi:hypothetical protein